MFKKLLNKKMLKNEKGLTLIELLAVIVILAIVAAIAIPAIGNIIDNSRIKAAKADVVNIISSSNIYFADSPGAGSTVTNTDLKSYVDAEGVLKGATYTVTKADGTNPAKISVTGTIKVGNKDVTISGASIDTIEVDSAKTNAVFSFK